MSSYSHQLRIVFSALCGLLVVLLCGLWVRSYSRNVTLPKLDGHTVFIARGNVAIDRAFVRTNRRIVDTVNFELDDGTGRFGVQGPTAAKATGILIPVWLLLLIPICGVVAPWISLRRFSLRTLLIAITLASAALGLVIWLSR